MYWSWRTALARDERMIYVPALDGTLDVTLSLTCDTMPLLAQSRCSSRSPRAPAACQCVLEALLALEGETGWKTPSRRARKFCPSSWQAAYARST